MRYPLPERIGEPELLTGREKEFALFHKWIERIPKRLSKSRVILARRKSGKTAFIQRLFNQLWSENGKVIPLFFEIGEEKKWFPDFAIQYYCSFASQYISFLERKEPLVTMPMDLQAIKTWGKSKSHTYIVNDVNIIMRAKEDRFYGRIWELAYTAPERFAAALDHRFLVIIDEFQNLTEYIYRDKACETGKDETIAGSFHGVSESKIAPMLVTGSYVGWLVGILDKYLEAGRLKRFFMNPYLTPEEGLQAVFKYAEYYEEPITNETATQINQLCQSDPFFISCVMESEFEGKDLTTRQGVVNTVNFEISDRRSEMSMTWGEYIELTLQRVNDIHAKTILLHMSKHADRYWTPKELKETLEMDITPNEIQEKLRILVKADLLTEGISDIDFKGLQDGTLYLILRNRFEKEISNFEPDLKKDFNEELDQLQKDKKALRGKLNNLVGKFAEYQLATDFRSRKRFPLSVYFDGLSDDEKNVELNIINVKQRVKFHRPDGKEMEIDVLAESDCGRVVLVEVKKRKEKIGIKALQDFQEKCVFYEAQNKNKIKSILPAFLSTGGFTDNSLNFCREKGIGTAEGITWFFDNGKSFNHKNHGSGLREKG
ncbi:conserved hypothetical protein [Desulfamplus magnetovallimortis]|uniref:ATPase domain protein, prokaryote domain protein n=1 Tax=Desulfamplus magnetovallimortis TaxID=1246637 RepID=A0A1W1HG18_9BACT|nr:hypothetical protein [Desulfamplus magnetovallimortis]SLM31338.1 conserved hypothetical protein [Desulfamplus magnetovallimortis]